MRTSTATAPLFMKTTTTTTLVLLLLLLLCGSLVPTTTTAAVASEENDDDGSCNAESAKQQQQQPDRCADPLGAVLRTIDCITTQKDAYCAAAGYHPDFVKFHNGVLTNDTSGIHLSPFWDNVFGVAALQLDINFTGVDKDKDRQQVSLRYVETVIFTDGANLGLPPAPSSSLPFPFGQTFLQHEHALVTVNKQCQMVEWDQYGDNAEQEAIGLAVGALLAVLGGGGLGP